MGRRVRPGLFPFALVACVACSTSVEMQRQPAEALTAAGGGPDGSRREPPLHPADGGPCRDGRARNAPRWDTIRPMAKLSRRVCSGGNDHINRRRARVQVVRHPDHDKSGP